MAAVASHEAFFADVRRLFVLLDFDGDGKVDQSEATLGLSHCFEAVHHIRSPSAAHDSPPRSAHTPAVSAAHKAQAVAGQVSWLFSATHHSSPSPGSPPTPLELSDFNECYQRLLASSYEPEVLHVDLSRAIAALELSQQWRAMGMLLTAARRLYGAKLAGEEAGVQRAVVQQAFRAALADGSSGWSFASPKRRDAVRAVAQRLLARPSQLTEEDWLQAWKDAVSTEFDYAAASRDVDAVAAVSTEAVNGHR